MGDTGELYQFGSVYRHFVLNKDAVVRRKFDTGPAKSYYLCTIVLFDISKDSDIFNCHELLPGDVVNQHARYKHRREEMEGGGSNEGKWGGSVETEL